MTRDELIKEINQEEIQSIFDPYDCGVKAALALVDSLPDELLPTSYAVDNREPVFSWNNKLYLQFMTRYSFRYTNLKGEYSKGHPFRFKLDEKYLAEIKKALAQPSIVEDDVLVLEDEVTEEKDKRFFRGLEGLPKSRYSMF